MNIPFENLEKIDLLIEKVDKLEAKISGAKRWLNVAETAHYLGYSKEHIHKMKDSHFILNIHYFKKSGRLLFDKVALDKWVTHSSNNIDPKAIADEVLKDLI